MTIGDDDPCPECGCERSEDLSCAGCGWKPPSGHANTRTETVRAILQTWLRRAAVRWDAAVRAGPPDFASMYDMPDAPGHISLRDLISFAKNACIYEYPRPSVTVDVVVFGLDMSAEPSLNVLLIKRGRPGTVFEGHWAIPGGFVDENEDLEAAARRELREETHAEPAYIEQLYTFGKPGRDPRGDVKSVAYMALVRTDAVTVQGDDDAAEARWWPVEALDGLDLAFDHKEVLAMALRRLRTKIQWEPIGIDLLPETFTIGELRAVYETVLGKSLDRRNFHRKVMGYGVLESAESQRIGGPGRPAQLWRFDRTAYEALIEEGQEFEV